MLFGLHDGIPSVMTRDPDGASLAGAILAGANRTFLVPAVLAQVLQAGPDAVKLFGALKTYTYGAAPMPPPLLRAAMEAWPDTDFLQVYGLTEVAGVVTHLMPDEHRSAIPDGHPERLVSAGRAIPGVEVRIVAPGTLEDVATGEPGEIWLRTPQRFQGYLNKPEATAEVVTEDGWFRSGDLGRLDAKVTLQQILQSIIEPSKEIKDKFRSYLVVTDAGRQYTGMILEKTPTHIRLASNPLGKAAHKPIEIPVGSIELTRPLAISLMPEKLVNTLSREEILDLVAYIEARGRSDHRVYGAAAKSPRKSNRPKSSR